MLRSALVTSGILLASSLAFTAPASALTMKECSVKYDQAKTSNSLGGLSWNEFRKAQCGSDAAAAPTTTAAPAAAPTARRTTTAPAQTMGGAVFPTMVSQKYASEKPGAARRKTCLDQYNANKVGNSNGNGGLKWIQKGGGYYSQCNNRLKGA